MGYTSKRFTLVGRISNHNSEQDEIDEEAWGELVDEIQHLLDNPEWNRVVVDSGEGL